MPFPVHLDRPLTLPPLWGQIYGLPRWGALVRGYRTEVSLSVQTRGVPGAAVPLICGAPCVHSLSSPWAWLGMSSLFPALTRHAGPPVSPGWRCSEAGHCQVQLFDLMFQSQVLSRKLSPSQASSLRKIDVQLTGFASC